MTDTIMTLFGPEIRTKRKYKQRDIKPLKERFDEKWIPEPNSGCWLWEACVNNENYGTMRVNNVNKGAHRISYELYKGEFDKKLYIRHKCDNPTCVNPDHLEPGTNQDNMNDMIQRGRSLKGTKHSFCKLTEEQVMAIFNDDRTTEKISEDYVITRHTVSSIKIGKSWSYLTGKKYERSRLSEEQVKEIYIKANNGYKIKVLMQEYNMSKTNIYEIKNGSRWGWLTKDIVV